MKRPIALLVAVLVLLAGAWAAVAQTDDFQLAWWSLASGGTSTSDDGTYTLEISAAQLSNAGTLSGGDFTLEAGFLAYPESSAACPDFAPPAGTVDVADVQVVADHWRAVAGEAGYGLAYDRNHDGIINVVDVMRVVTAWGACP